MQTINEIQRQLASRLPLRDVVLHKFEDTTRLDYALQLKVTFVDEFGDKGVVDLVWLDGPDWDFNSPEEWFAEKAVIELDDKLTKAWIRTRWEAWHIDAAGPDSLEEYIGMTTEEFAILESDGTYPEGWVIPQ